MKFALKPAKKLSGSLILPGDKSISHRAVMLGSLAEGTTFIRNFLHSDDTRVTSEAFRALGITIKEDKDIVMVEGKGLFGLSKPSVELSMGNSGTSMRILMGILAGQPFKSVLTALEGLAARPMRRVTEPLSLMGAKIDGRDDANYAPITIEGPSLKPINYVSKIASAQIKSAILFAGLYAGGVTSVMEPSRSRDHTERMMKAFGADIEITGLKVSVKGAPKLLSQDIEVSGDISSAAFFMVGASIVKGSKITLKSVGLNPTRAGIIEILKRMGARITIDNRRESAFEPLGDITVESANLRGITIAGDLIPRSIDELPVIMIAAAYADGITLIKGAGELRVKETDRINSISATLNDMGAKFGVKGSDIIIEGVGGLNGAAARSFGDHRTAMSIIIAALAAKGETVIDDVDCINKSYPNFITDLESILK